MKEFFIDTDIGLDEAQKYHGRVPTEDDYDLVVDADEVDDDFRVWGPANMFGERELLAGVARKVFPKDIYDDCVYTMMEINHTSDLRTAQAGPWDPDELFKNFGWVEGEHYMFKGNTRNALIRKKKDGTWDTVARGKAIHSVLLGYKKGRFTGQIELDAWSKKNPEKQKVFFDMNHYAAQAYEFIAPKEYKNQVMFADKYIKKDHRLNDTIFTTMSANKYTENDTSMMGYHIDAGDLNSSLTCISVFKVGDYKGAYFIVPQHRVAISVGDGDVFVGDSRKQHGVSEIEGPGTRLSCVSYCDTRMANVK